ncbi:MAG: DUF4332 domain-containing protein [Akkermansiaceae bacterium]|nr:DUF4332 domain-containing protein [Akkermansiaceae bacterium]
MIKDQAISKIPDLGKFSIDLLGAVGIVDVSQLAQADPDILHLDLTKANGVLVLRESSPSPKEVISWIESAREITGIEGAQFDSDLDQLAEIEEILVAIPVHGKRLAEQGIKATDVPVMETVVSGMKEKKTLPRTQPITNPKREFQPDADPAEKLVSLRRKVPERPPYSKKNPLAIPEEVTLLQDVPERPPYSKKNPLAIPEEVTLLQDVPERPPASKWNSFAIPEEKPQITPLLSKRKQDVRVSASKGLNTGKKLHSRTFIRGVLNPHKWRMRISSLITLLMFALMPASLVALGMVMKTKNLWWFVVPAVFLVTFFFYLTVASRMKCRVCGQPVFSPKYCRKHIKAHRVRVFGYIIPTSVHMILFHWFRCIYCGTSVRLRK